MNVKYLLKSYHTFFFSYKEIEIEESLAMFLTFSI